MTARDYSSGTPAPRGLGGLVTTEVERLPLGTHHGRELHARVERRSAKFSAGRQWHLAVGLGRTRPVAIEVSAPGEQYDLPISTTDPWWRLAQRIGMVLGAAGTALLIARRIRGSKRTP
jgi:hypothetical protein